MKKLLKICLGTWENASRDKKELSVVRDVGFDVAVLCKGEAQDKMRKKNIDGFNAYLCSTRPFPKLNSKFNRIIATLKWIQYVKSYKADVLSCHDLGALQIGYLSNVFKTKNNKALLIYDAHEFEIGRNTDGRRNNFTKLLIRYTEKFLMNKCELSIMVNDTIAEETQRIHRLADKPLVIRNVCQYWHLNNEEITKKRAFIEKKMPALKGKFLIMYHGGLFSARGIEQLLKVVEMNENICALILGNGSESYKNELNNLIKDFRIENRVLFHPAVPHEELWKYVGAADVGMVILQNICTNHYYALPNKYFENIQSMTPIICSNFPELERLTNKYNIGLSCDSSDAKDINNKVEILRTNNSIYTEIKKNLKLAKEELCWEKEYISLKIAYENLWNKVNAVR